MAEERVAVGYPAAPESERELVERVLGKVQFFERGVGKDMRERSLRFYRQYRGFEKFSHEWNRSRANDRDTWIREAQATWGSHLHIPLSFRTIETIVPRTIAQMPKLLVVPRDEQWIQNAQAVRLLLDAQQQQIDIDLPFQAVMRSGRIYGLGVGKDYWRRETAPRRRAERRVFRPGFRLGKLQEEVTFDDPTFEDVDIFDFMWDPYGSDTETCEWMAHRIWMSQEAVLARIAEGVWKTQSAATVDSETLKRLGQGQRYDEIWKPRMEASGFGSFSTAGGAQPHELIEFHDGQRVLTVLDREVLVQDGENPCCGDMPFQIYRPTPIQKQLVGIGDLEPLEHLQRELDTLRSQRRDAATIALCAGYVYDTGAVDAEDIVFGPAAAIPVTNARPQDALWPIPVKDVPGSGYQEEQSIRADVEAVSGMQDALDNRPGGQSSTATEAQLVQAALGQRIQLSSRRFEIEVVRHVARNWLFLDQRMILEQRSLRLPEENISPQEAAEHSRWKWFQLGPGELLGEYEFEVEGGSMAARNTPQDRADATQMMNLFGRNLFIDPTKPLLRALELCGVKHPQSWLRSPEPPIPLKAIAILRQAGVDPALLQAAVIRARKIAAPQEDEEGEGATAGPIAEGAQFGGQGAPQTNGRR